MRCVAGGNIDSWPIIGLGEFTLTGDFINTGGGFADASNIDLIAPLVQEQIR